MLKTTCKNGKKINFIQILVTLEKQVKNLIKIATHKDHLGVDKTILYKKYLHKANIIGFANNINNKHTNLQHELKSRI